MKNRILICTIAIITLIMASCNKDKNPVTTNEDEKTSFVVAATITEFLAFLEQMKVADKTYYIESYSGIYDKPQDDLSSISATIRGDNEPYTLVVNNKTIGFSDYDYNLDNDESTSILYENMTNFYGKNFDLQFDQNILKAKSDGSITNPISQVYVPKLFYPVTFENLAQDGKLTSGSKIIWDVDILNDNGVVIGIEYYPSTQTDSLNRINYPEYMLRGQLIDDDGEFTFSSADFADFPGNADLSFYIVRGGFTTFEESGDKCAFVGVAITGTGFTISIP